MMKVILDTSIVLGAGSSYHYFSELIPRLRQEPDLQLEVVPSPYTELPREWFSEQPSYQRLPFKGSWLPKGRIRSFLSKTKQQIELYRQKQTLYKDSYKTIFHSFYYTLPADKNLPIVSIIHDTIPELLPKEAGTGLHIPQHLRDKKMSLNSSKRIIAVSESTKRDVCRLYSISPDIVDVIYHSAPTGFFIDPSSKSLLDEPYFLQVGGRMHHRNFKRLAEAFALGGFQKDHLLVCVGSPWSEDEQVLLKKLGIDSRTKLFPNPNQPTLRTLYQHAEMLVYPSLYEGFGFPLVEAMECGTPIATSKNSGSIPEVAGNAGLYFDPRDPSDMAKTMNEILDPKRAEQLIKNGFKNKKRFSWEETTRKTIECYRKALDH